MGTEGWGSESIEVVGGRSERGRAGNGVSDSEQGLRLLTTVSKHKTFDPVR